MKSLGATLLIVIALSVTVCSHRVFAESQEDTAEILPLSALTGEQLLALRSLPRWDRLDRLSPRGTRIVSMGQSLAAESAVPGFGMLWSIWRDAEGAGRRPFISSVEINGGPLAESLGLFPPDDTGIGAVEIRSAIQGEQWALIRRFRGLGVGWAGGWSLLRAQIGGVVIDASPQAEFNLILNTPIAVYLRTTRTVLFSGRVLTGPAASFLGGSVSLDVGPRLLIRAHWRALTIRFATGVRFNSAMLSAGNQLFVQDFGGPALATGRTLTLADFPLDAYASLGVGYSWGGQHTDGPAEDMRRLYAHAYRGPARAVSVGVGGALGSGTPGSPSYLGLYVPAFAWIDFDRAFGWSFLAELYPIASPQPGGIPIGPLFGIGHRFDVTSTEELDMSWRLLGLFGFLALDGRPMGASQLVGARVDGRLTWQRYVARVGIGSFVQLGGFGPVPFSNFALYPHLLVGLGITLGPERRNSMIDQTLLADGEGGRSLGPSLADGDAEIEVLEGIPDQLGAAGIVADSPARPLRTSNMWTEYGGGLVSRFPTDDGRVVFSGNAPGFTARISRGTYEGRRIVAGIGAGFTYGSQGVFDENADATIRYAFLLSYVSLELPVTVWFRFAGDLGSFEFAAGVQPSVVLAPRLVLAMQSGVPISVSYTVGNNPFQFGYLGSLAYRRFVAVTPRGQLLWYGRFSFFQNITSIEPYFAPGNGAFGLEFGLAFQVRPERMLP